MKTPDHISKKRQGLKEELTHWKAQLSSLLCSSTFDKESKDKIDFCNKQIHSIILKLKGLRSNPWSFGWS